MTDTMQHPNLYAPSDIIQRALAVLGKIDLDPATDLTGCSKVPAKLTYTEADDGLSQPWQGRVWLYPPQSRGATAAWVAKLLHEHHQGRTTSAILYTPLDARGPWFQHLSAKAALCFPAGAIRATCADGSELPRSRAAALIAYLGQDRERFTRFFSSVGSVVEPAKR